MAKLTEEGQRAMFARTLRTFDDALCEVRDLVALAPCSAADLASALDKFAAEQEWLREYIEQAERISRTLNDPTVDFLASSVLPALREAEIRLAARGGDTAEAVSLSIRDARVKLLWCLHQLE